MTASDVLKRYQDEDLPEFAEVRLQDVNQKGNFGNSPMHIAAVRGIRDEIEALIAAGANVNAVGELGNRPLHEAAGQGHTVAVELLLGAGAAVDAVNDDGKTARDVAEVLGLHAIARLLESASARH